MSNTIMTEFAGARISPSQRASAERGRIWAAYLAEGLDWKPFLLDLFVGLP